MTPTAGHYDYDVATCSDASVYGYTLEMLVYPETGEGLV
jgi:hypothetical protein